MKKFLKTVSRLLVITCLVCLITGCTSKKPETLKVMSFNIQTQKGADMPLASRSPVFSDILRETQPDSIGMQEVTVKWLEYLDSETFGDNYTGVGEANISGGEACSIYYRADKFDLLDQGTFWLSDTPDVAGSVHPDSNYVRTCTWVHLKNKQTKREYIHVNTHLDNTGSNASATATAVRLAQGKVVLNFVQTLPDVPLILTGDFNQSHINASGDYRELYQYITGQASYTANGTTVSGRFSDARLDAADTVSPDAWATMVKYHKEGEAKDPARKPIDFIFYTADHFQAQVYRNIEPQRDYVYASDHMAQYCELLFK